MRRTIPRIRDGESGGEGEWTTLRESAAHAAERQRAGWGQRSRAPWEEAGAQPLQTWKRP